jgi:type I restriction enzyme S subunit
MKGWREDIFNNFIKLNRGFDLPEKDIINGNYPVVASTSIKSFHNDYKIGPPAVVTGRSGSLGTVQYINQKCWPLNTSLYVKDFKGNYPKYVYYFLQTFHLENFNSGAGVPTLNQNHLHKLNIKIPVLPIQRKIAAVLSAYDDLIENNNRRIAILEKMAEELYREWFVRLRFPGHENVKIVKGVPEGWEVKKVEDLIIRIPVGKRYEDKTVFPEGRVPVLDQGQSGIIGYHNDEPGVYASPENPIIVFANHTCYQRIFFHPFSTIQNVLPFRPNYETPSNIFWLHYTTKDLIEFSEYKGHWPEFSKKSLYYPGQELTERFGYLTKPFMIKILGVQKTNNLLKQSRDRLLSRLMSGKIDVENLNIQFPASMLEEVTAHA